MDEEQLTKLQNTQQNEALLKEGNRMRGKIHVILDRHLVKIDETIHCQDAMAKHKAQIDD